MMQLSELINEKEVLGGLETEPLVDYLQKHGVLSPEQASNILAANVNRNLFLLEEILHQQVSSTNPNGDIDGDKFIIHSRSSNLFINALRHTGYHKLASLLDNERPIGYNFGARRRGQISVIIQVSAVKVSSSQYSTKNHDPLSASETAKILQESVTPQKPQSPFDRRNAPLSLSKKGNINNNNNALWIDVADVAPYNMTILNESRWSNLSNSAKVISHNKSIISTPASTNNKKSSWFTCFTCIIRKKKKQQQDLSKENNKIIYDANSSTIGGGLPSDVLEKTLPLCDQQESKTPHNRELEAKAQLLNSKSELFYQRVHDSSSTEHDNLLRYFEQRLGVLVLDSYYDEALVMAVICTKLSELKTLKSQQEDGSLARNISKAIVSDSLLSYLELKQMKLSVEIDSDEYQQVVTELSAQ